MKLISYTVFKHLLNIQLKFQEVPITKLRVGI
jgi:hypothetical protein